MGPLRIHEECHLARYSSTLCLGDFEWYVIIQRRWKAHSTTGLLRIHEECHHARGSFTFCFGEFEWSRVLERRCKADKVVSTLVQTFNAFSQLLLYYYYYYNKNFVSIFFNIHTCLGDVWVSVS